MPEYTINKENTNQWKHDIQDSVTYYNYWFLNFAPSAYIESHNKARMLVDHVFERTNDLNPITADLICSVPQAITVLRMITTPPLARDRLVGLANVSKSFIEKLEESDENEITLKKQKGFREKIERIIEVISELLDTGLIAWVNQRETPEESKVRLVKEIVADRISSSMADPFIRNEQEKRQKGKIKTFLEKNGYKFVDAAEITSFKSMESGTFSFGLNVPVMQNKDKVDMPIDVVIMRKKTSENGMPLLIECKSAGDSANTNKRRKEEATKMKQLKDTYGDEVEFILFLGGYFGKKYLEYEANEGIDWDWEHRIEDFLKAGV